ncbi:MAG: beta-phosphoglucomutase [Clostridia bacterium]|nr:beta-phosphoglucomutase [Clostridia bacterium]
MIKGVIFDLDGVLVRTDDYHYAAWSRIAERLGVPFDRSDNRRLLGVGRRECLDILLEKYDGVPLSDGEKASLCDRKNDYYRAYLAGLSPDDVPDEVLRVLGELRRRGLKLAVGSSSRNARLILERTRLLTVFDGVSDGGSVYRSKPAPDVFLHAAALLRINACDCAVVEDAPAGVRAAKDAGMTAVALGDADSFKGVSPDYVVSSLGEVPGLDIFSPSPVQNP